MELNADLGEDEAQLEDGRQAALLELLDAANVACGGHAGDRRTMMLTVAQCLRAGVAVGAHPSAPDREAFGRAPLVGPPEALEPAVVAQLRALHEVCAGAGVRVAHVKPHGALYHAAGDDEGWARMLARALRAAALPVPLVLLAGARTRALLEREGVVVRAEGFADRAYTAEGRLVPRGTPGALLLEPAAAAAQARRLRAQGGVDTLCVHGDTPAALDLARAVRGALGPRPARTPS